MLNLMAQRILHEVLLSAPLETLKRDISLSVFSLVSLVVFTETKLLFTDLDRSSLVQQPASYLTESSWHQPKREASLSNQVMAEWVSCVSEQG